MTDTFAALVTGTVLDVLASEADAGLDVICDTFLDRHPDAFESHGQALALAGLKKRVKDAMCALTNDDDSDQLALPGLHLPTALAYVREDDGQVAYVRADKATWSQLVSARALREENVVRAQARLRQFDATLDRLRPHMESAPEVTVAQALLAEQDVAA